MSEVDYGWGLGIAAGRNWGVYSCAARLAPTRSSTLKSRGLAVLKGKIARDLAKSRQTLSVSQLPAILL